MDFTNLMLVACIVLGWWLGHRRGVQDGAQSAMAIEHGFGQWPNLSVDRDRLRREFQKTKLSDPDDIRKTMITVGELYSQIIRRSAIDDCRTGNITEADRLEWRAAFGVDMPPITYPQGYNQAIQDFLSCKIDVSSWQFRDPNTDRLAQTINTAVEEYRADISKQGIWQQSASREKAGAAIAQALLFKVASSAFHIGAETASSRGPG